MLKLFALLPLLLSAPVLGAPAGHSAGSVTVPNGTVLADRAPDGVHVVDGTAIIEGYRGQPINFDVTQRCYIVGGTTDAEGHDITIQLECIQSLQAITTDIRRFGQTPTDCEADSKREEWTVTDSSVQDVRVKLDSKVDWGPIESALGIEYSNQHSHLETYKTTVSCEKFTGEKCFVGGAAVWEAKVKRGWVDRINSWDTSRKGSYLPQWDGFTDPPNYGMRDLEDATIRKSNSFYPSGWDLWHARGNDCYVGANRNYELDRKPLPPP